MTTIALFGAGGKIGCRITDNLKDAEHRTLYIEMSEVRLSNLQKRALSATPQETGAE